MSDSIFTARGICKRLELSPYKVCYRVDNFCKVELFFSSITNKARFDEKVTEYLEKFKERVDKLIGADTESGMVALLKLYNQIEKRGFFVKVNDFVYDDFNAVPFLITC